MKILCLFVRYGTTSYAGALPVLDAWYERHGLLAQRTLWIIDNSWDPQTPPQALGSGICLRPGDNAAWEFSAWARALREAQAGQIAYDVVHFVTSAFNTLYTGYLDHFSAQMLSYVAAHNVCLGHIDSYDRPIELNGSFSDAWIRTCFFFLPASVSNRIPSWAAFTDPNRIFASPTSADFRTDAILSVDYQQRIGRWLNGHDVGGHAWHSPIQTGAEEARRFQKKTLAILNEHNFSITLRKLAVPLVDFCWLWSRRESDLNQTQPPGEGDQLAIRRRILGITS